MNPNLNQTEFEHSGEWPDIVRSKRGDQPRAYAEVDPNYGREGNQYFLMWIQSSERGAGQEMVSHLNEHYGARPAFAEPEENTEPGNRFIERLRKKGLAD